MTSRLKAYSAVPENMTFSNFKHLFSDSSQHYFPVVDSFGKLTGIFSVNDVRGVLFNQEIDNVVMMKDIGTTDIIFATPSDDLNEVLKKFTIRNIQSIPVVRDDDHSILIGMLDRREVIRVYNEKVEGIKAGDKAVKKSEMMQ